MIEAWNDLPTDIQQQLKDIKVICGYKRGLYTDSPFHNEHMNYKNHIPMVRTNEEGKTGLFFPFFQTFELVGRPKEEFDHWWNFLWNHCVQEKFIYHHDWEDGDILINEQWLSQHKRWPFNGMDERVLHRVAFDPRNVYPNFEYL
jgi:alpha-ketoglutarate-dependent taurine dioxygenase